MKILFPGLFSHIKERAKEIFNNVEFEELFLEKNYIKCYDSLPTEKGAYSIYALNTNGTIGHYYFNNLGKDEYYERNLSHMFKELSKSPILSGNSALFIAQIQEAAKNMDGILGYRNHSRNVRLTRNFALQHILKEKKGIVEPKNTAFSKYFDLIENANEMSDEKVANIAIAKAYEDFLSEYKVF